MAHAWKACWVKALGGSNPPSSASSCNQRIKREIRFSVSKFWIGKLGGPLRVRKANERRVEVFLKGGLGNQLFQYAAARGLASHVGAERLILNLSYLHKPIQLLKSVSVRSFELAPFVHHPITEIHKGSYRQAFRQQANKSNLFSSENRIYRDKDEVYDDGFWKSEASVVLEGYFHSHRYFENVEDSLRRELRGAYSGITNQSDLFQKRRESNSLGVHVRRGDYLTNGRYQILTSNYYEQAIETGLSESAATSVYFFSDDPEWLRNQSFARLGTVISDQQLSGLEEFLLLSSCDHFVIANSSFSWWAAWLGENPKKRVYAPHEWFTKPSSTPESYFPSGWTRVPVA